MRGGILYIMCLSVNNYFSAWQELPVCMWGPSWSASPWSLFRLTSHSSPLPCTALLYDWGAAPSHVRLFALLHTCVPWLALHSLHFSEVVSSVIFSMNAFLVKSEVSVLLSKHLHLSLCLSYIMRIFAMISVIHAVYSCIYVCLLLQCCKILESWRTFY